MSDDLLIKALESFAQAASSDPLSNQPTVRYYIGTWASAEVGDPDLSTVFLQGGAVCRNVPRLSHVTGLTAGNTILMVSSPTVPMHIVGVLVGNIQTPAAISDDTSPPTIPTSLAVTSEDLTSISLSWAASTDDVGVSAYDIFVDEVYKQSVIGTTATVSNLEKDTAYSFTVRARDAASNVSPLTSAVVGTTDADPPPDPDITYVKEYAATWARSYNQKNNNAWDSWYTDQIVQGQYGGGNQKALIGFNWAQIMADLAGGAPVNAEIRLTFFHWWSNAGGTAVIGTHNYSSPPGSFTGQNPNRVQSGGWPRGATRWVTLGAGICDEFRAGTAKGITIGPGASASTQYYGKAYGYSTDPSKAIYVPTLKLTFVR